MSKESKQTVIENGTEFDGKIKSDCSIKLSGNVKGVPKPITRLRPLTKSQNVFV